MLSAQEIYDYAKRKELSKIIAICEQEIRNEINHSKGGNEQKKRASAAMKYIKACQKDSLLMKFGGAWNEVYQGDIVQCLCNGATGVMLYNKLDNMPVPSVPGLPENMLANVFNSIEMSRIIDIEVDVNDIRLHSKLQGKYNNLSANHYHIDSRIFDHDKILSICDIIGGNIKFSLIPGNSMAGIIVKSDNGIGLILPLRQ